MPTINWANWVVSWDLDTTKGSGLKIGVCIFNGIKVLHAAGQPFVLVPYHGEYPVFKDGITHQGAPYTPVKKTAPNAFPLPPASEWVVGSNINDFVQVDQHLASLIEPASIDIWAKFQPGNYQYVNRWQFMADGSIHVSVGLGARLWTFNPPTAGHIHHFYFRMDFDIDGFADDIVERFSHQGNQPGRDQWSPILVESKELADPLTFTKWRVRNKIAKDGGTPNERYLSYEIIPGSDANRDGYSTGDLWVVRWFDGWGEAVGTTDAALEGPPYMNGQSIDGQDVAIWYALHSHHEPRLQPGEESKVVPYHFIGFHIQPRNFLAETPLNLYTTIPPSP
jgi:primary-amine oxidase